MIDLIAATLPSLTTVERQTLLETPDVKARLKALVQSLTKEAEVLELGSKIHSQIQSEMTKTQREYYLREQLKAIQKELGEGDERGQELTELREKIEAAGMSEEAHREAMRELDRLTKMPPAAAEYSVARTYLEWLSRCPGRRRRRTTSTSSAPARCSTRITGGSARSRTVSWSTSPSGRSGPRARRRFSASWDRPASARPLWADRSPAPSAGSSTGSRSAGCGTRRRSAATGGRTSGPSPGRSSRGCGGPSRRTRSSCWTRSTSSASISGATRRRRSSRCWTRSRTRRSGTTISMCPSISRGCCSSPPRTCWTRSRRRSVTAWRSSSCPGTPRTRRSRSRDGTWRRSRRPSTGSCSTGTSRSRTRRSGSSYGATRGRRACGASSGRSPRSAGRPRGGARRGTRRP